MSFANRLLHRSSTKLLVHEASLRFPAIEAKRYLCCTSSEVLGRVRVELRPSQLASCSLNNKSDECRFTRVLLVLQLSTSEHAIQQDIY